VQVSANERALTYGKEVKPLADSAAKLGARFSAVDAKASDIEREYRSQADTFYDPTVDAPTVQAAAKRALHRLEASAPTAAGDANGMAASVAVFTASVAGYTRVVDALAQKFPACHVFTDLVVAGQRFVADSVVFSRNMRFLEARQQRLEDAAQALRTVATDPARYYAAVLLPRSDAASDVTVTVSRRSVRQAGDRVEDRGALAPSAETRGQPVGGAAGKTTSSASAAGGNGGNASGGSGGQSPVGATQGGVSGSPPAAAASPSAATSGGGTPAGGEYQALTQRRLRFGREGRFGIGVGALWSPLRAPAYGTAQRTVPAPPGRPADTSLVVIVQTRAVASRIVPLLSLNTLLWNWGQGTRPDGIHLLFGTSVYVKSGDTDLDYFTGLGISFLQQRLQVTPGISSGRKDYLADDLQPGDAIPTSDVPIRHVRKSVFGIALTFRVY